MRPCLRQRGPLARLRARSNRYDVPHVSRPARRVLPATRLPVSRSAIARLTGDDRRLPALHCRQPCNRRTLERRSMAKLTPIVAAIVFVCLLWPGAGHAATDDLAALRAELEALKTDYTSRVQALEARIKQLESSVVSATTAPPAYPQPSPVAAPGKSSNATAFNPAMSMILTGNYASLSQDPATYRVAGFIPA